MNLEKLYKRYMSLYYSLKRREKLYGIRDPRAHRYLGRALLIKSLMRIGGE